MTEPVHVRCERLAAELIGADEPTRVRLVLEHCERAAAEGEPALGFVLAQILRDREVFELADFTFEIAMRLPGGRFPAMFEYAVSRAIQGQPGDAVRLLEQLREHGPLSPYGDLFYAHQLGRVGRVGEANKLIENVYRVDKSLAEDCLALPAFFDYIHRFTFEDMERRCRALLETYPFRSTHEVAADIRAALADRRPWALMRLNDGEGSILHLSVEDELRYRTLYQRARRHYHHIWFGDDRKLDAPAFLAVAQEMTDAVEHADCVAAWLREQIVLRYRQSDVRNIHCIVNVVRKLEHLRDTQPDRAAAMTMADPMVNQFLLFAEELNQILEQQKRIGLVSCHPGLPDALKQRFGIEDVRLFKTPGEALVSRGQTPEPFPEWHDRIKAELTQAEPGVLHLVAAGVTGKVYCQIIKQSGGVALDIGSVADIWMKVPTRAWFSPAEKHVLV